MKKMICLLIAMMMVPQLEAFFKTKDERRDIRRAKKRAKKLAKAAKLAEEVAQFTVEGPLS